MSLLRPGFLSLLIFIPILAAIYLLILKRRKRFVVRYSSLSLIQEAAAHQSKWRRHAPFTLFLLTLTSLTFSLARPTAEVTVPSNRATIILAMDVSLSMCSTDIPPNRLTAAQQAALSFIQSQSKDTQIGVVAFAGFAELIQAPTRNRTALAHAIHSLTPGRRTAIGSAILRSIDAIAEADSRVPPVQLNVPAQPSPPGESAPHMIVLLTDGSSNAGPSPFIAANEAAARGIHLYTIGFGTVNNTSPLICGDLFASADQFSSPNFGFGSGRLGPIELDEFTLRQIAEITGGVYSAATSAEELQTIFHDLPMSFAIARETTEIGVFFNAFAILLLILAFYVSLKWNIST